jgi:hypothetical protein
MDFLAINSPTGEGTAEFKVLAVEWRLLSKQAAWQDAHCANGTQKGGGGRTDL